MGLGLARSVITTKITRIVEEPQVEAEVTGSVVAALFGLDGFRVLAAADAGGELELLVETIARVVPCPDCGAVARPKDRRAVWVRDLPIGGRPVVVCWHKRVWCCPHALCPKKTWTEEHPAIEPRACLTDRARAWAFEQVGARDGAVSRVASALGVGWATIMRIIITRGQPIIDDPARLDAPTAIGVDETAFLRATGPAGAAAGRGRRPVRGGAGRLAARARRRVEGADRDRIAGPVPRLRHRVESATPARGSRARPVPCHQARADRARPGAPPGAARCPRASGSSWRPALRDPPHPAPPCRPALRAGLGSAASRTRRRRPVRAGHRRLDHRPGPDALLPAPRRQRRGSSHHRRPRLPSSRNRPPGKNIAHMAGGVPRALRPHRRLQWADRSVEPEDQEHQAHRARIPQLRQLPAPPPSQPRPNPEQSSDITDPNPPSQLGGVEPLYFGMWFKLNGQSSALGNRFKRAMNDAFDDFVGGILHRVPSTRA